MRDDLLGPICCLAHDRIGRLLRPGGDNGGLRSFDRFFCRNRYAPLTQSVERAGLQPRVAQVGWAGDNGAQALKTTQVQLSQRTAQPLPALLGRQVIQQGQHQRLQVLRQQRVDNFQRIGALLHGGLPQIIARAQHDRRIVHER